MYTKRITNLISEMKKRKLKQLIVSDKMSIFYLTGCKIDSGERLLCLYVNTDGIVRLIINRLFGMNCVQGVEVVQYSDEDDSVRIIADMIDCDEKIGIDKNCPSGYLIRLSEYIKCFNFVNSSFIVDGLRLVKDKKEQQLMKESSRINDQVMAKVRDLITEGIRENELADKIIKLYKEFGAEGVAFNPIVSFGKNAADPHHVPSDVVAKNGDCVVIDIGCIKNNYASDMTRTFFIGDVSAKFEEIYNVVKEANLLGINASKPGARMCDVDFAVRSYIESKGYGEYFIHRTGHSIGLEDHEVGDVSVSNPEIIKEGQIFSIEPGIYIPELNIGVRIEDLVLITGEGCEPLTTFTKDLKVVK